MRIRTIVALLFLFLPLTLQAQYSNTWNSGVTDLTSYLPTTNTWKALPQGGVCLTNTLSIGNDGTIYCRGTDYFPYTTTAQGTWAKVAAMGTNIQSLAVQDANDVYSLQLDSYCTGQNNFSIYKWSGSAWGRKTGCLSWLSAAGDGTLEGVNANQDTFESSDGGTSWTQISGHSVGPNLKFVSAAGGSMMCGTNGVQVFVLDAGGAFNLLSTQPTNANAGVYGCAYENDQNGQADSVYVWGTSTVGIQRYDINAGAWSAVNGMNTSEGLTTAGKGMLLGLDSGGHPYHLNVYGAYLSITVTGSDVNGCGPKGCTGALHRVTTQVQFQHSLSGQGQTEQAHSPSTNVNQSSFDFTAACDPLFGDPNDSSCTPTIASGTVFCTAVLDNIFTSQGPPPINTPKSVDGRGFDGSIGYYGYTPLPGGAIGHAHCGMTQNACAPHTAPTCPTHATTHSVIDTCTGKTCTEAHVDAVLLAFCEAHDIAHGGAWRVQQQYTVVNGETVCSGLLLFFGGAGAFPVQCE